MSLATAPDRLAFRLSTWSLGPLLVAALLAVYLAVPQRLVSGDNLAHHLTALSVTTGQWGHLENLRPDLPPSSSPRQVYLLPARGGGWVSGYGVGVPLALVPAYGAALALGVSQANVLSERFNQVIAATWMALAAALFVVAARRLAAAPAVVFSCVTFAIGSSALSLLSREVWQHSLLVLLQAATVYSLVVSRDRHPRASGAFAGFLAGWSVLARPTGMLYALCWLWAARRLDRRTAHSYLLGLLPGLAVMGAYNWATFGSPFALGQLLIGAARFGGGEPARTLGLSPVVSLVGSLFSPGRGLFVYSPVFLLAAILIPVLARSLRRRPGEPAPDALPNTLSLLLAPAALVVLANLVAVAAWKEWWGGFTYGPRYLSESLVAWCVLLLAVVELQRSSARRRQRRFWAAATVLLAASCFNHAAGLLVNPYEDASHNVVLQPDQHPEAMWRWSQFPPLYNLRVWYQRHDKATTPPP